MTHLKSYRVLITALATVVCCQFISEAEGITKIRLGTYDSRAIAVAFTRSEYFKKEINKVSDEISEAKTKMDTITVKKT